MSITHPTLIVSVRRKKSHVGERRRQPQTLREKLQGSRLVAVISCLIIAVILVSALPREYRSYISLLTGERRDTYSVLGLSVYTCLYGPDVTEWAAAHCSTPKVEVWERFEVSGQSWFYQSYEAPATARAARVIPALESLRGHKDADKLLVAYQDIITNLHDTESRVNGHVAPTLADIKAHRAAISQFEKLSHALVTLN